MRGITAVIVTVLIALVVGVGAYQLGVAQGAGAALPAGERVVYHPIFWGFPFFGILFPILFFFLLFALARAAFWGGRRGWGYGPYAEERRARLAELHRELHREGGANDTGAGSSPPPTGR
jgi:hypothetical protein